MIKYHLSPEDVARVRFVADPAWNVCSSLSALVFPQVRSIHRELAEALSRQDLPAVDFLRVLASDPRRPPSIALPHDAEDVPGGEKEAEARIREAVRAVPDHEVEDDLAKIHNTIDGYEDLTVGMLRQQTEAAVVDYWSTVLKPFWDVAQSIATQDLAQRADDLLQRGLGEVINSLSPKIRFTGSTLELEHPMELDEPLHGGDVIFIPVVFHCPGGFILHGPDGTDPPGMPLCVAYPASGFGRLREFREAQESPFTRLLGATRARVLDATEMAATTSTIARQLGLPSATVSGHLTVLAAAGFLARMRRGRYVYYQISPAGRALITAQEDVLR